MTKILAKINNKKELYNFLNNVDYKRYKETSIDSVYFLVRYVIDKKEYIEPIYFYSSNNGKTYDGGPCTITKHKGISLRRWMNIQWGDGTTNDPLNEFDKEAVEYERKFQVGNIHYVIDSFLCEPFLPKKLEVLKIFTEKECLKYFLKEEKRNKKNNQHN